MQTMNNKTEEPNSVDPPEDHLNNRFYRKILNALLTKFNHFKMWAKQKLFIWKDECCSPFRAPTVVQCKNSYTLGVETYLCIRMLLRL